MKKPVTFKVTNETPFEFISKGNFGPQRVLVFSTKKGTFRHLLKSGHRDELEIYYQHGIVYAFAINRPLGYASLEAFEGDDILGALFVEGHEYDKLNKFGKTPNVNIFRSMSTSLHDSWE